MRWQGRRESDNVEDRRQSSDGAGGGFGGGGFPLFSLLGGKGKIIAIIVVIVAGYYGVDLTPLITGGPTQQVTGVPYNSSNSSHSPLTAADQQAAKFTSVILATTEDTWKQIFQQMGKQYTPPKLVMYRGSTQTACGAGQTMMGPFYCPNDGTVYIDLAFYDEMKKRLGGGGDFAQGYVIAHEVGHHVQHLLGIEQQVRQLQQHDTQVQANQLSVKLELQADCFAGIWGNAMQKQNILDPGDLQEALNTAQAIGDDTLQKENQGRVMPDSFTHGTSEQRYQWFKRGFDTGDINNCNTFAEK